MVLEFVGLGEGESDDEGSLSEESEDEKAVEDDREEVRGHFARHRPRRCADLLLEGLLKGLRAEDALFSEAQDLPGEVFWLGHCGRMSVFSPIEGYSRGKSIVDG